VSPTFRSISQEAASLALTDDNFAAIVGAIREWSDF
jgi:hypothetical protein